jgi:orotate phosphoribosyltransferase
MIEKNDLLKIFTQTGALLKGHFLLTSGRHSDTYFQCALALQFPEHVEKICSVISNFFNSFEIDTIISPAIGGLVVGQEIARQLNKRFIFVERENDKFELRRGFSIKEGEKILVCEDVVTTGGSVFETIEIVKSSGGIPVGVGSVVDRSNGKVDFGIPFCPAIRVDAISYVPEECPLCKTDIPLVKPGSRKVFIK